MIEKPLPVTEESAEARFVKQLLNKAPEARLGGSVDKLMQHEWLNRFEWKQLFAQTCIPPFTPDIGEHYECLDDQLTSLAPGVREHFAAAEDEALSVYADTELEEYKASIPPNWDDVF